MSIGIASSHQAGAYRVSTDVYEGPLDLLLQLIERAELDITKLALAQVTNQFLEHLRRMQERAAEEVSTFLVIAAKLIQIKSEVLLPRPPTREPGEEDPGEALALQLLAYKRYRDIANLLAEREAAGLRTYLRIAPPPRIEGILDLEGITAADLAAVANSLFSRPDARSTLSSVVPGPKVTIREKIQLISSYLKAKSRVTFKKLLGDHRSRLDIVVTFLALLELVKRHLVTAHQEGLFGEIELEAVNDWNENEEFDLEFGE
jgi:segregation and condensation protein A